MKRVTAKQFYNRIKNKSKYKLVNGLFIVRDEGNGNFRSIGDFHKKGSVLATKDTAYVKVYVNQSQIINPSKRLVKTRLGVWKKLNIGFRMKPISEILK